MTTLGMDGVLENGPWMIRNVPIILKKWSSSCNLLKEKLNYVLFGVKLHDGYFDSQRKRRMMSLLLLLERLFMVFMNSKVGSKKTAMSSPFDALNSVESDNIIGSNGGILTNADDEMLLIRLGSLLMGWMRTNKSDVEHVYDETTCFMDPKSGGGAGGKRLYER
uniref:DUF4283 domain-containing protein n=1 Tax=Tanacetum cinerariifolium TaxID=118510 RepID=A0A699JSG8_TANCI|nr:hypothetical protein [Tanacetum cinerariifolium]